MVDFPLLDAATGKFYNGRFQLCNDGITDKTTGPYALLPGQKLFFVPGRTLSGQWKIGALVRAFPNVPYAIHPGDQRVQDGSVVWWRGTATTSWANLPVVLPFVPATVGKFARGNRGEDMYGYTDLIALPGYQSAMAPLNKQSVIIAVGGVSFADYNGLHALISGFEPNVSWTEVLYAQRDEPHVQIHRAFIPLIPRARIGLAWSTLALQHPLEKPGLGNEIAAFALIGVALAAIAAGNSMSGGAGYSGRPDCGLVPVDTNGAGGVVYGRRC